MNESEQVPVSSPPAVGVAAEGEDEVIRRRLCKLQAELKERFDRAGWDEYVRLRRAARISG